MMMENFEYCSLFKQLNEEQRLIFNDVMHKFNCNLIHRYVFFTRGARIGIKKFTLKLVIQELLRLHNRDLFSDLTKSKALLMASIGKVAFNIDSSTIHSTLNILVQQPLSSLPNLSLDSLNRLTCQYE
jgi:hypothetical protein